MSEQTKLLFYSVDKCGYYRFGNEEREFGGLEDLLDDLSAWVHDGKSLGETCTYEVEEGDVLRTFCFDMVTNRQGDYLLTTWNETPSLQGQVASVSSGRPVGAANVHLTGIPRNAIPGYATYFWFIPQHNLFATIRFQHALNGHRNLNHYLKEYLAKWSSHVVVSNDQDADHSILGYRHDQNSEVLNLRPAYMSSVLRHPGSTKLIVKNRAAIRRVIRKNLLLPHVIGDRNLVRTLLIGLGIQDPPPTQEEVKVKYEFEHTPTAAELETIIAAWENEHETRWDDVGFQFQGDSTIHWLSHTFTKHETELDVVRENAEIVNAASLLKELSKHRHSLLRKAGAL